MLPDDVPAHIADRDCPDFGDPPWVAAPSAAGDRQVSIVSTAGLIQRGDRPFSFNTADYRIIDAESAADLLMTHVSTNFDRAGFVQDHELVLPLQRLRDYADSGKIGGAARFHYSFMGAAGPEQMRPAAEQLARTMAGEGTNIALLVPV